MDKTLEKEAMKKILTNSIEKKTIIKKQIILLQNFISSKAITISSKIDKESFEEIINSLLGEPLNKKLNTYTDDYENEELKYYSKVMETVSLIFSSSADNTRQLIYLENIIKKIDKRANNFTKEIESSEKVDDIKDREEEVNKLFQNLINRAKVNYNLDLEEVEDLAEIVDKYREKFISDFKIDIGGTNKANRKIIEDIIEREIYNKDLRKGKTRQQFEYEKKLVEGALKTSNKLLDKSILKHKDKFIGQLDQSATKLVDLIFEVLPKEYEDQRQLLEVILDTDIKERLTSLAEKETKTERAMLSAKNENILENELYDEKRYKNFPKYEFESGCINKVYEDILKEVRDAYLLPNEGFLATKLNFRIKIESANTKDAFDDMLSNIKKDNANNLCAVIDDLSKIRKKNIEPMENKSGNPKK